MVAMDWTAHWQVTILPDILLLNGYIAQKTTRMRSPTTQNAQKMSKSDVCRHLNIIMEDN